MRIFSIRRGLEIDSSETDYIFGAYDDWLEENIPLLLFFKDISSSFEDLCPNWNAEAFTDAETEFKHICAIIKKNPFDSKKWFLDLINDFWGKNQEFNESYFLTSSEEDKGSVNVFHEFATILDIFKIENPFFLFSHKIGIRIGDPNEFNFPQILKFNEIQFEINDFDEYLSFLLLFSTLIEEDISYAENLLFISIFPNYWENLDLKIDETIEVSVLNTLADFKYPDKNQIKIFVLQESIRAELINFNKRIFGELTAYQIRDNIKSFFRLESVPIPFFIEWLESLEVFDQSKIEIFQQRVQDNVSEVKDLIETQQRELEEIVDEKERREHLNQMTKLFQTPGYFFIQLRNKEKINELLKKLEKFFNEEINVLSTFSINSVIKEIGIQISNLFSKSGRVEEAIVHAINSGAYLAAAALYKKENMKTEALGLEYRAAKGLEGDSNGDSDTKGNIVVPITIDLFPHYKKTIKVAMVQLALDKSYFDKSDDYNAFFIKNEKEEEVFSKITLIINKLQGNSINFLVFPELAISFSPNSKYFFINPDSPLKKLLQDTAFIRKQIIIPGTFYNRNRNIAPTIFPTMEIIYTTKNTLASAEDSPLPEMAIKKGKITPLFKTNFGNFAVLICRDLFNDEVLQKLLDLEPDIIFNPSANTDISRFNEKSSSIVENYDIFIIQPNLFYSEDLDHSSSIYSILHNQHFEDLKLKNYKKTDVKYEIYSSEKKSNEIVLLELNLKQKRLASPSLGIDDSNIPLKILEVIKLDEI